MSRSEVGGQIKTRVDALIKLIETREQISAPDAAQELGVGQETIESWARFLEKTGDVKIVYKGLTPTFVKADKPVQKPTTETQEGHESRENPWHEFSRMIGSHISQISEAIGSRAYEKVKPAVQALKEQLRTIKHHLEAASLEAKDREALEQSIERVENRISTVENNASANRSVKLKRETRQLTKEIETLTTHLSTLSAPIDIESETVEPDTSFEERIERLESSAREAVEKGDLENAELIYAQIRELYEETLPKQYEQMRSTLKDHIYSLKKDITFATDEHEKRALAQTLAHIGEQLTAYEQTIATEEWDALETIENDIVESYNRLPAGLEDEKKRVEDRFGSLLISAAQERRTHLNDQLRTITDRIRTLRDSFNASLQNNAFDSAYEAYNSIRALFEQVPAQLVVERIELQSELLDDFRRLSNAFKERFIAKNEKHIETCTHLIEAIKRGIETANIQEAQSAYDQALAELSHIDHNYFEQRSRLQYDLMRAHKDLLDHGAQRSEQAFEETVARFQQKLQDGRSHLLEGATELAERIYLELLEMYRTLPSGHEDRKRALREQIFDYYKTITTSSEQPPVSLDEILERLVSIHHALNAGDPTVLTNDLTRIEQLIDALPDEVRKQNPMLDRELLRLVHLRRIYDGITESNASIDRGEDDGIASFIEESESWLESHNVSAAAVSMMLRALASRMRTRNARVPIPQAPRAQETKEEHVADLKTRIDSIRSLLKE